MADPPRTAQINLKLSREHYATICAAAARHHVAPMRYCIDLLLSAPETRATESGQTPPEPAGFGDVPSELAALRNQVADLQSAVAQLGTRLAGVSTQTGLIATLEQVLGVRTILHNLARETFTGEGEMAELRALADDSTPELASEILAAVTRRLTPAATADTQSTSIRT